MSMLFLRSLLSNTLIYPIGFILVTLSVPFWVWRRSWARWVTHSWGRATLGILRHVSGIELEVRGREHMPRAAALIACKHQSSWETVAMFLLIPNVAMIVRQTFFYFTPVGWLAWRIGMLRLNRTGHAKALRQLMRDSRAEVRRGRCVCIFPEGTRRPPGAPAIYHSGVAGLYRHLDVPCVPVALNSGLFWPRRQFLRYSGRLVMEFLPPIAPGMPRAAFMRELEARIEPASARLLKNARRGEISR